MHDDPGVIASWAHLVRRRWPTGLVAGSLVLGVAVAVIFLTRPVYRSEAALRLGEPPPPGGVSPTAGILSFLRVGGDPFANDLELLSSRTLAESIVDRVALSAQLIAPAGWHRDSVLTELRTTRETRLAAYDVEWTDGRIRVRRKSASDSLVVDVAPGEPAVFDGVTAVFRPWREGMPREVGLSTVPFAQAVRRTRSAVAVERPRREANVVAIAYGDTDPDIANAVVLTTVTEFMRLRTQLQQRESGQTVDSLRAVARGTAAELRQAEDALASFQRASGLVAPEVQGEALVERQADVMTRLERARAELAAVDEMLGRLDDAGDSDRAWTSLLSYPAFLENQTLGEMLTALTLLYGERANLGSRLAPTNRDVVAITRQIEYFEESLRNVAREYRIGLHDGIAMLEPQAAAFDSILATMPASIAGLGRGQRDVRILTEIVILTEQRLRQEELRQALTYSNVQVIDAPALRDRPVWPRKKVGLLVGMVLAGAFAMLAMVVRDRTDFRIRRVAQVSEVTGRPVLAVIEAGRGGVIDLSPVEMAALLRRAGITPNGGRALTLVPLRAALVPTTAALPPGTVDAIGDGGVTAVHPIRDFGDAAAIVATDAPTALLAEAGRTTADELRRVIRLIEDAGGTVAGVVLVCHGDRQARSAWS
jgi:uncharacterized protein involved in exopolysaccharide biosynthesis